MARGWESKSVEAQQSDAADKKVSSRTRMNPEQAARFRERERLNLARKRVMQQIEVANNPRLTKMLRDALADLDRKLKQLQ